MNSLTYQDLPTVDRSNKLQVESRSRLLSYIVSYWLWFGLLTGLIESAIHAYRALFLHQLPDTSQHIFWMAPLSDVIIFALPAVILLLFAVIWPKIVPERLIVFVFSGFGYLSLVLYLPLHKISLALLAIGLAVITTRIITQHTIFYRKLVRQTIGWLIAIPVMVAVLMFIIKP